MKGAREPGEEFRLLVKNSKAKRKKRDSLIRRGDPADDPGLSSTALFHDGEIESASGILRLLFVA